MNQELHISVNIVLERLLEVESWLLKSPLEW